MKREDREYIHSLRTYFLVITVIFLLSAISGLFVTIEDPGIAEEYFKDFEKSFQWIKDLHPLLIMLVIFLNNAIKSFAALVLGIGFGFIPVIFVSVNGMILSMVAYLISKEMGIMFVIAALLPHGIIEIPMVLVSAGIGLRLGHIMFLSMKGESTDIKTELKQGVMFYMRRIVPLLFLAAVIETFITPVIAFLLQN